MVPISEVFGNDQLLSDENSHAVKVYITMIIEAFRLQERFFDAIEK
jgi:hypothetical protein